MLYILLLFLNIYRYFYTCILFYFIGANNEMKCCNIIRNAQVSLNTEGTIRSDGLTIEDSCILENNATYIFWAYDPITLSNCTVDSTNHTGSFTIKTQLQYFIHALNHMSAQYCHAGMTRFSSPTMKAFYYTYKETCKNK